jgi:hypothetical protein
MSELELWVNEPAICVRENFAIFFEIIKYDVKKKKKTFANIYLVNKPTHSYTCYI